MTGVGDNSDRNGKNTDLMEVAVPDMRVTLTSVGQQ